MNDFEKLDPQARWEMCALNALQQAVEANARLAHDIQAALNAQQPLNPLELLIVIADTQHRLARDLREMRRLSLQR